MAESTSVKHIVRFGDVDCEISVEGPYKDNRQQHVIQLYVAETEHNRSHPVADSCSPGEPYLEASVFVPDFPFACIETAIKDYAENKGIFDVLIEAGIVEKAGYEVRVNHMLVPVVRILI